MSKLEEILSAHNKKFKEVIATVGLSCSKLPRIPFSSPRMQYMTYGGLPRGLLHEFFGAEGSGKTTTLIDLMANAQVLFQEEFEQEVELLKSAKRTKEQDARLKYLESRGPLKIVFMDAEHTLDPDWCSTLGLDISSIHLIRPQTQTAEQLFQLAIDAIATGEVGLFGLDSLAYLVPQNIYDKTMEDKSYAGISGPLTVFCTRIAPLLRQTGCCFVGINQVREEMNAQYVTERTPGGKAWKHGCCVRIKFRKGRFIDEKGVELPNNTGEPAGNLVDVSIQKTKAFLPNRRSGSYTLNYKTGIDIISDLIDIAEFKGYVEKSGSWYSIYSPETGEQLLMDGKTTVQGKAGLVDFLNNNHEIAQMLLIAVEEED